MPDDIKRGKYVEIKDNTYEISEQNKPFLKKKSF